MILLVDWDRLIQAARAGRQHPLIKMQRDKRCIGGRGRLAQAAQLAKPIENILPDLITQFIEWAAVTFIATKVADLFTFGLAEAADAAAIAAEVEVTGAEVTGAEAGVQVTKLGIQARQKSGIQVDLARSAPILFARPPAYGGHEHLSAVSR